LLLFRVSFLGVLECGLFISGVYVLLETVLNLIGHQVIEKLEILALLLTQVFFDKVK